MSASAPAEPHAGDRWLVRTRHGLFTANVIHLSDQAVLLEPVDHGLPLGRVPTWRRLVLFVRRVR